MSERTLFQPVDLGPIQIQNRIVMAPLTRSRATPDGVPRDMHVEYYRQRATAGLIITEATNISGEGRGYAWTPGIWTDAQVEGWRKVTDAVHAEGGHIYLQLWHVGRVSHPDLQPGNALPVAPSAIAAKGQSFTEEGMKDMVTPRALSADELPRVVEDYRHAARQAKAAGFDGVEIHSANGYLLDQFLRDGANKRDDAFGGSVENRLRFPLQVVDAVVDVWGPERTGIRISPVSPANDLTDSDPKSVFLPYVEALSERRLAYLHVVEGATGGPREVGGFDLSILREKFSGLYMGNNDYSPQLAAERVASGAIDLACFGRPFISNPDLVRRIALGAPLAPWDKSTFYGGDERGYTDYPPMTPEEVARSGKAA